MDYFAGRVGGTRAAAPQTMDGSAIHPYPGFFDRRFRANRAEERIVPQG